MEQKPPTSEEILWLVADLINPLFAIERTMVLPTGRRLFRKWRHENVGEHSLGLGLAAASVADVLDPTLDTHQIMVDSAVHDVTERHAGDITVWASPAELARKPGREAASADQIEADHSTMTWIIRQWRDFEERLQQGDREACYTYAFDKLYAHFLVLIGNYHPVHPTWKAYLEREQVARAKIESAYPGLLPLFDDLCARFREHPHFFRDYLPWWRRWPIKLRSRLSRKH